MKTVNNSVRLIGRLGMDPEIKELKDGKKLAKFSLATDDSFKDQEGNKVKETQWHNLVIWGKLADVADRYLKKGNELAVEGKLTNHSYLDKDGKKHYVTEINVNEMLMLGGRKA